MDNQKLKNDFEVDGFSDFYLYWIRFFSKAWVCYPKTFALHRCNNSLFLLKQLITRFVLFLLICFLSIKLKFAMFLKAA